jgi:uncharacterized hydrophobic protein (TIGR00271 family)
MVMKSQKTMKPRRAHSLFGLLKNDLEFVDGQVLRQKIYDQSKFSILYFILLIGSTLVCTLGLLTDNAAIVIGGMLIAPLMWPLARIGYGISHSSHTHLLRGSLLLIGSILIGAITAFLITSISPVKVINSEILARTSPTLMDLFIALTAGFVAAIAITQKKIADSLAGVAIAVSLMPPLCTVGIALSLRNYQFSAGALLLFAVNAACITFVTTLVLAYNEYVRTKKIRIARKAVTLNVILILALTVPLVNFLRSYSFEVSSYSAVTSEMNKFIERKSAGATFENIELTRTDGNTISVQADLLIPNDSVFSFSDNEVLIALLENAVGKDILLNLRIQIIVEPISKYQSDSEQKISAISSELVRQLTALDESYKVSSINVFQNIEENKWVVNAEIVSDPELVPTAKSLADIDTTISQSVNDEIELNLTFLPRLTLRTTDQTISQETRKSAERITKALRGDAEVSYYALTQGDDVVTISYTITSADTTIFDELYLDTVKRSLSQLVDKTISLRVRLVMAIDISL